MQPDILQIIIPLFLILLLCLAWWRLRLKKLAKYQSPILGKIEVLQKYNREKVLTINSYPQGVSIHDKSIKKSYWHAVASLVVKFCHDKKNPQILMLGLGAATIPNLIAKMDRKIHQTIIEIDKFIIEACRELFDLDQLPNYNIIQSDAYKLFNAQNLCLHLRGVKLIFDIIIVDIFTGHPPYIDLKSNQPDFIEKVLPCLKPDGMIIFNRPGNTKEARLESLKLEKHLSIFFEKTRILDIKDPRGFRNSIITARQKIA